jgi:hypothetical protein
MLFIPSIINSQPNALDLFNHQFILSSLHCISSESVSCPTMKTFLEILWNWLKQLNPSNVDNYLYGIFFLTLNSWTVVNKQVGSVFFTHNLSMNVKSQ